MRISFVTETLPPEVNGVALTVARTIDFLRARGHEVDVIHPARVGESTSRHADDDLGEWRCSGWPIPVYRELRFGLCRPSSLVRRFRRTGAQLVHVATEGPLGWAAVTAAERLGLACTSDFRTNFHQYSRYYGAGWLEPVIGAYLRRLHNRTHRSFVPTRQTRHELTASGFERIEVVGRGVDLKRFSPTRRQPALRQHWAHDQGPVLLHVGRLAAEKRVGLALRAYRAARALEPRTRMVVVGDGPCRAALAREYPEVRFVGTQTGQALAEHYASADMFLFPSQSETFGNVTLEALASGLPVVAFDMAAAAEHVVDQLNGLLVAPGRQDDAFVQAACSLASRRDRLPRMSAAARRSAVPCAWDGVLRHFEDRLLEVAHETGRVRTADPCIA